MLRRWLPQIYIQLKNVDISVDMQLLKLVRGWREFREKRGLKQTYLIKKRGHESYLITKWGHKQTYLITKRWHEHTTYLITKREHEQLYLIYAGNSYTLLIFLNVPITEWVSFSNRVQYINLLKQLSSHHISILVTCNLIVLHPFPKIPSPTTIYWKCTQISRLFSYKRISVSLDRHSNSMKL